MNVVHKNRENLSDLDLKFLNCDVTIKGTLYGMHGMLTISLRLWVITKNSFQLFILLIEMIIFIFLLDQYGEKLKMSILWRHLLRRHKNEIRDSRSDKYFDVCVLHLPKIFFCRLNIEWRETFLSFIFATK